MTKNTVYWRRSNVRTLLRNVGLIHPMCIRDFLVSYPPYFRSAIFRFMSVNYINISIGMVQSSTVFLRYLHSKNTSENVSLIIQRSSFKFFVFCQKFVILFLYRNCIFAMTHPIIFLECLKMIRLPFIWLWSILSFVNSFAIFDGKPQKRQAEIFCYAVLSSSKLVIRFSTFTFRLILSSVQCSLFIFVPYTEKKN